MTHALERSVSRRRRYARLRGSRKVPAPWLASEHNERLAEAAAERRPRRTIRETELEARAGWRTIEIFVALLPTGWG